MELVKLPKDASSRRDWWLLTIIVPVPAAAFLDGYVIFWLLLALVCLSLLTWASAVGGGLAWKNGRNRRGPTSIPGPRGLPIFGSLFALARGLPHRTLAAMAAQTRSRSLRRQLMAFSLGSTPLVVSSDPKTAHEILTSPHFADRPVKQSAKALMFSRAIGFAPNGTYWRLLRRIASSHLFSPRRIAAHEPGRQLDCAVMLRNVAAEQWGRGKVTLREHLRAAALNNIMGSVFGRRYDVADDRRELKEVGEMVREGFEVLGAFNWCDYLPWLSYVWDPHRIIERCEALVPRVRKLVRGIIQQHKLSQPTPAISNTCLSDNADFVHVLLSLDGDEKLNEDDMVAVLWEMIFRGTDTTALLTEWVMAELVLHVEIQTKLWEELKSAAAGNTITDADVANLPYLQAVIKETLRVHPPGPLLSWARLSTSDVQLSNGMLIPAHTTAMVNMWAITHDPCVWEDPHVFNPDRFLVDDVDVRGCDLRLAPFGAGRRVCPGKNLGLVTASLWVAKLVYHFKWDPDMAHPVDLSEVLKLSCEMKHPLSAVAAPRNVLF